MPTLRKIVATPKTDRPMYQKNTGSRQVERGVHQRIGFGVPGARHVGEIDLLVALEQRARLRVQRLEVRLLHLPSPRHLLDHQLGVAADPGRARRVPSAARSPAMSARYSATLLVVSPIRSLTVARRCGGLADASYTTAPIAAGPGLPPRATVEVDEHCVGHQGTRIAPQLSQCASGSPADFLICSASMAGTDRWQLWQVLPTSRATPTPLRVAPRPLVVVDQPRRRCRRRSRRAPLVPPRISAIDHALGIGERLPDVVELGPEDGAPSVEVLQRRVEGLARLHQLELAVLDTPLVAPELLDVGLHCLQLAVAS